MRTRLVPAMLALILVGAACGDDGGVSGEDAQRVGGDWSDAVASGEPASLLALLTDDAELLAVWGSEVEPVTRAEWELERIWYEAQGTTYTDPRCGVVEPISLAEDGEQTVRCEYSTIDAATAAAGGEVETVDLLVVATDAIRVVRRQYPNRHSDFASFGIPFDDWMAVHHPEDAESATYMPSDTAEELRADGQLRARYAAEWARYLADQGCGFDEGC